MISIYIYENLTNDKVYIGQSNQLERRDYSHVSHGQKSMPIDNAIKKYGRENFSLNVITSSDSQEIADADEVYWIARARELLGRENVYNIADGGNYFNGMKGKKHSEEAKIKIGSYHIGNEHALGIKHSEETKKLVSESLIGNTRCVGRVPWNKNKKNCFDEETVKRISDGNKGKIPPNKGKSASKETLRKMSEARKGKPWTEARRAAQK
jgi:group I intron endonuclease